MLTANSTITTDIAIETAREERYALATFLNNDPEWYGAMLTLARLHEGPRVLTFEEDNAEYDARRQYAERFLAAAIFGHCPSLCYAPVAVYPDGTMLDYPSLDKHECASPTPTDEPKRWAPRRSR